MSEFNRNNIDHYLYEIAKEYKKRNKIYNEAEITLIGGASMLINYNFRDMTTDIDALIKASSTMKEIINKIGDENNLPNGWLNDDFKNTKSYTPKIFQYSKFYKKFCNCLSVRTIKDEYLIAMKLCSGRIYKKDLSDIIGILKEHQEQENPINYNDIDKAMQNLYNGWGNVSQDSIDFLNKVFQCDDLESLYYETLSKEKTNKKALLLAEKDYKNEINDNNLNSFLTHFIPQVTENDEIDLD